MITATKQNLNSSATSILSVPPAIAVLGKEIAKLYVHGKHPGIPRPGEPGFMHWTLETFAGALELFGIEDKHIFEKYGLVMPHDPRDDYQDDLGTVPRWDELLRDFISPLETFTHTQSLDAPMVMGIAEKLAEVCKDSFEGIKYLEMLHPLFNGNDKEWTFNVIVPFRKRFKAESKKESANSGENHTAIAYQRLLEMGLRWNELLMAIEDAEGNDIDTDEIWHDFRLEGIKVGIQEFTIAAKKAAKTNAYHPVRQYLESVGDLPAADIKTLSRRFFGTLNPIYDEMFYRHLIASVARVFNPGCKKDEVLVLQGKQGILKSTFWATLYGEFFTDAPFTGDRDDLLVQHRYWARELAELEHITGRKQAGEMKAFLSRSEDTFREPYGRCTKTYKRGSVFVGSVNPKTFLFDDTGNRRFWVIPVEVEAIAVEALAMERDAIWAAAVQAYRQGEKTYLSRQHSQQINDLNQNFRQEDSWLAAIRSYLEYRTETTVSEVLTDCLHFDLNKVTKRDEMRVSGLLGELDWKRGGRRSHDGRSIRFWVKDQPTLTNPPEVGREVGQPGTLTPSDLNQPNQPNQPIPETFISESVEVVKNSETAPETKKIIVANEVGQVGQLENSTLETTTQQALPTLPTYGQPPANLPANPPDIDQPPTAPPIADETPMSDDQWIEAKKMNDPQLSILGWDTETARQHLISQFGVNSRRELSYNQFFQWQAYCQELSPQ